MSQRIEDFPIWKVGGSFATAAILAWVFDFAGLALLLALVGAGFLVGALVVKRRSHP